MTFHNYPNIHRISLSCILCVMLFCFPAAADMPQTPALFQWELDQNLADDGTMGSALVDQDSITYVASEPDPPGYGTHGASFDGSTDYLSLENTVVGNRACNGTDHEATFYADFTLGSVSTTSQYIIAKYAAISGGRQLAPIYQSETGVIGFLWGYNGGDSYQAVELADKIFGMEHLSVALSIDVAAKTYTLLVREWDTGTYWVMTEADEALTGTYHSGTSDLTIGARSDSNRFFNGTIWRAAIYDELHTRAEMEAVIEKRTGDPIDDTPTRFNVDAPISVNNNTVIDADGKWVGDSTGLQGPQGGVGPAGPPGPPGPPGPAGSISCAWSGWQYMEGGPDDGSCGSDYPIYGYTFRMYCSGGIITQIERARALIRCEPSS